MSFCEANVDPLWQQPMTEEFQFVGSLIYLTVTRPDIVHAVHIVSQLMAAPRTSHHSDVLHILRYLKGTFLYGLHFSSHSSLTLSGYSDVDWSGDPIDCRWTTSLCFFLDDSFIFWRNKKQTLVSRSSAESEYHALTNSTSELLLFLSHLLLLFTATIRVL
ncbi:secreted RxLR effector protein 161-like [Andrographis paniculata]|uniref:secreted RxLR effector protein 161-like n=1 Tax=Andrographis paniculata TaxID=175694 RepID=UPI0021E80272|nr:secreted RxLR effector protein 161-like [Andrographis paniculata]